LFIPQVIYEHGKPWWNDVDRGKLLIPPPLCQFHQQSSGRKQEERVKEMMDLAW
jgi:hypothetical protein